jgi:hypothetical protein
VAECAQAWGDENIVHNVDNSLACLDVGLYNFDRVSRTCHLQLAIVILLNHQGCSTPQGGDQLLAGLQLGGCHSAGGEDVVLQELQGGRWERQVWQARQ